MMMVAPILITLVIAIGIIASVIKISKGTVNRKGKYVYSNRVRLIFGGYLAILLICLGLDTVLPVNEVSEWEIVNQKELEKESLDLYEAAIEGRIDTVDRSFISKEWNLDYPNSLLNVVIANDEFINSQIVVERKETNDSKIEAVFYRTRSSMNEMDITEMVKPLQLEMAGDTLKLLNPEKAKIEFYQFENVFSTNQFTGGDSLFEHHTNFFEGQSILYLRIPKDLELTAQSNLLIQYVE
jgi:hypothetical protein